MYNLEFPIVMSNISFYMRVTRGGTEFLFDRKNPKKPHRGFVAHDFPQESLVCYTFASG